MAELAVEDWDRVQAVNPRAPFVLSKAVLPHMRAAGNGTIVSVSSVAGKRGWANAGEQATRPQSEGPAGPLMWVTGSLVAPDAVRQIHRHPTGQATRQRGHDDLVDLLAAGQLADRIDAEGVDDLTLGHRTGLVKPGQFVPQPSLGQRPGDLVGARDLWVPESRSWVLSWEFARAVTWSR